MIQKDMQFVGLQGSYDLNTYSAETTEFKNMLSQFERLLEEENKADVDYNNFLLNILAKEKRAESNRKRGEKDRADDNSCYCEEENDPQYELFLKSLKRHEKTYILESKKNGFPVIIKYEGDSSSDKCDLESKRKLRSATKRKDELSTPLPSVGNQCKDDSESTPTKEKEKLTWKRLRSKSMSGKEKNVTLSNNKIEPDSDYLTFTNNLKAVENHYVFIDRNFTVVYDLEDRKNSHEKEEYNDECFSDVEILDNAFNMEENLNISTMNKGSNSNVRDAIEFRQKVIAVLRKPYNEQEYYKLWQDIELHKPEERHMELRNGRERSYSINKEGKSYLDHHPGLERKLLQFHDDKPKCLNLLRGFFFWLKHSGPPFYPWEDAECLAIKLDSG